MGLGFRVKYLMFLNTVRIHGVSIVRFANYGSRFQEDGVCVFAVVSVAGFTGLECRLKANQCSMQLVLRSGRIQSVYTLLRLKGFQIAAQSTSQYLRPQNVNHAPSNLKPKS